MRENSYLRKDSYPEEVSNTFDLLTRISSPYQDNNSRDIFQQGGRRISNGRGCHVQFTQIRDKSNSTSIRTPVAGIDGLLYETVLHYNYKTIGYYINSCNEPRYE